MPSWTFDKAPTWAPKAIATDKGWVDPKTGEVLVACTQLVKATPYDTLFEKGGKPKKRGRGGSRPGAGRPKKVKEPEVKVETPVVVEPVVTPEPEVKVETPKAPAPKKAPAKKKPVKRKSRAKAKPKAEVKTDND